MNSTKKIQGQLLNGQGDIIGTVEVANHSGLYSGSIDLSMTSAPVIDLFRQYEEIVNGQMLSLIDTIDAQIKAMDVSLRTCDQDPMSIHDLQVYPSEGKVSFRTPVQPPQKNSDP